MPMTAEEFNKSYKKNILRLEKGKQYFDFLPTIVQLKASKKEIQPFNNFLPFGVMEYMLLFLISLLSTYPSLLNLYSRESFKVPETLNILPSVFLAINSEICVELRRSPFSSKAMRIIKLFESCAPSIDSKFFEMEFHIF